MTRGTTPSYTAKIKNAELNIFKEIYFTIRQGCIEVTHSNIEEERPITADLDENTVTMTLTQEETLRFNAGEASGQLTLKFEDDQTVGKTVIFPVTINPTLYEKVV